MDDPERGRPVDADITTTTDGDRSTYVRQRTAHVDDILNTMADIVVQLDEQGTIRYTNGAVGDVLGYDGETLVGESVEYLFASPDANTELSSMLSSGEFVDRLLVEREITDVDAMFRTSDGDVLPTSLSASILEGPNGSFEGMVCVAKDISERRAAEERTEFLNSLLSHDIQNKLQIVQSYLEFLDLETVPDEQREYIEKAISGTTDATALIDRASAINRLDEGIETERIDLAAVVADAIDRHETLRRDRDVTVASEIEDGTAVRGFTLVTDLFANLIENALVHAEGSEIVIDAERRDGDVLVTVDDDGVGIPPDQRDQIFQTGFSTRDGSDGGRGMGLVRDIADACGGSVEATDSPLGGARFVVTLPQPTASSGIV